MNEEHYAPRILEIFHVIMNHRLVMIPCESILIRIDGRYYYSRHHLN